MKLPCLAASIPRTPVLLAGSQTDGVAPSGHCGTSWHEPFVRDSWGDADFSSACQTHDRCYETCGAHKADCDHQFERNMEAACRSAYSGGGLDFVKRNACIGVANTYAVAVEHAGGTAYRNAQNASGC